MTWEKILIRILEGERNMPSPYHKNGILNTMFVVVDKTSEMGYLLVWCSKSYKAVQFSRLKIPNFEGVEIVFGEDIQKNEVVHYELQDIRKFTKQMTETMKR